MSRVWRNKKALEEDEWVFFEFFLATELGMTVGRLRNEITEAELIAFAAYYELKSDYEKRSG